MNNDDLLKKIEKLFEDEREQTGKLIDTKLEPLQAGQKALQADMSDVKQGQARLEHGQQEQGKKLDEQGKDIKSLRQEHGEKLDTLLGEAEHARTAFKALENKVDETKTQVDEIKQRQRPRHAD